MFSTYEISYNSVYLFIPVHKYALKIFSIGIPSTFFIGLNANHKENTKDLSSNYERSDTVSNVLHALSHLKES